MAKSVSFESDACVCVTILLTCHDSNARPRFLHVSQHTSTASFLATLRTHPLSPFSSRDPDVAPAFAARRNQILPDELDAPSHEYITSQFRNPRLRAVSIQQPLADAVLCGYKKSGAFLACLCRPTSSLVIL